MRITRGCDRVDSAACRESLRSTDNLPETRAALGLLLDLLTIDRAKVVRIHRKHEAKPGTSRHTPERSL